MWTLDLPGLKPIWLICEKAVVSTIRMVWFALAAGLFAHRLI